MIPVNERCIPFICTNEPIVCLISSDYAPSVVKNTPIVGTSRNNGFSLIELVTTLAVATILGMIAIPAMTGFVQSNRLTTVSNQLIADIHTARTEAIKRGFPTIVCASTTGTTCSASTNWDSGWVVFADRDESSGWSQTTTREDVLIIKREAVESGQTVIGGPTTTIFDRQGAVSSGTGTLTVCNSKIRKSRTVSISTVGRASYAEGIC